MNQKTPQNHYDICIYGNEEPAFRAALKHVHKGDFTALVHTKQDKDEDFSPKEELILQALNASAQTAHTMRVATKVGIEAQAPVIQWENIRAHIRDAMERIAPHYSFERLAALGVHIIKAPVQDETTSAKETLDFRAVPTQNGVEKKLQSAPLLNLRDLPNWPELPEHLIILGNGPSALSLAQSLNRLGAKVSIVSESEILPALDRELYKILHGRLEYEGVRLISGASIEEIEAGEKAVIHLVHGGSKRRITGSHILVLSSDNLEDSLQTLALTDPEVAQIGLNENTARDQYGAGNFHLVKWRYQECDFAVTQRKQDGLLKLVTKKDGTVIGISICGAAALELVSPWSLAIKNNMRLSEMQGMITSYNAYSRMMTLAVDGYIQQIKNPARQYKAGNFWQSLIGG